ncbi:trans-aconitate 2-methyltransferase [Kineococcus sp. TBRC 1896]|uniref:Trans-aconitate 2-methyltransferase n=1 Tax=Kineococcus mangrovi TaxID=1660183 RepID=A0ABV4I063_9ACTN
MIDYYSPAAEFFDLVGPRHMSTSGPAVRAALAGLDTSRGPVLDVGAGTGLVTALMAGFLPDAEFVCAEPSPTMRAILTSRVATDPELRRRVTVVPESAQELAAGQALPTALSAAVVFGVAGHLTQDERRQLWKRLAEALPSGAPIVVELMGVDRPRSIPPVRMVRELVGAQTYEWWMSGEPSGPRTIHWSTRWKVFRDGDLVREVEDSYEWETFGVADLVAESGLQHRPLAVSGRGATPEIGVLLAP